MSQTLTKIEAILKDKYQPALANQINIEPSPFLEMIRKENLTNNKVKLAAPVGLNGGFGFGSEGLSTPKAGEQRFVSFELDAVDMYVDIQISNKTIALGSSNVSSMINALDAEIQGSYAAAKWNLSRALFGNGEGVLAGIQGIDENNNARVKVNDTARCIEGLTVDVYGINHADPEAQPMVVNNGLRILNVERDTGYVTLSAAPGSNPIFMTVQSSYKREITGLGAIFNTNADSLYGVSRTEYPFTRPFVRSLDGKITDLGLYRGIKDAKKFRGANIDLVMLGDAAFEAYQEYMNSHNTHIVERHKFVGGATGYSVLVGDQEVIVINESMVPTNEGWAVDTKSFILQQTPWEFVSQNGSIFTLTPNTSVYRALLASYGNLICSNPGGCVKFTNCAPAN